MGKDKVRSILSHRETLSCNEYTLKALSKLFHVDDPKKMRPLLISINKNVEFPLSKGAKMEISGDSVILEGCHDEDIGTIIHAIQVNSSSDVYLRNHLLSDEG